ncbi:Phosphoserine phosphatase 1 [Planctomycetes bacterium K2D]|uniref:Phosphoserine phosphatase 1 n=2 Tax=Botrimarina mediterranea TaxID=2528022 RepID=A0A518KAA7_9BACT|nr:Phosphoserine phosphatase 1 [Botrimarina mediterranea]QDV79354.1 Phosphoserine phosphatase 1 [Planctomycetes bacterium K2D]
MYLLRHGATPPNLVEPPVMQGDGIDQPLAPIGREQAARAAEWLAHRPIRAIYSSPLQRAMETAGLIAEKHGLAVEPVDAIREVKVGRWEGSNWTEVERNYPEQYRAFREDPGVNGYPGGETLQGLLNRVTPALESLMTRHAGGEFVVTAHSVVNRVYVGSLLGIPFARGYFLPQANCCVNIVRWRDGKAKLVTFNAIGHLM